jgi:ribosomal protein L22
MAERKKGAKPSPSPTEDAPEAKAREEATGKRKAEAKSGGGATKRDQKAESKAGAGAKPKADAKAKPKTKTAAKSETAGKAKTEAKPKTEAKKTKAPARKTTAKDAAKPAAKSKAAAKPDLEAPTVKASARYVRVAPRKVRHLADQIRGLPIDDARSLLLFSPRGAARDVAKLLDSAAANAENNHDLVADDLKISEIYVDEGPTLRRFRPRALGRATKIDKRTSHISLTLTPDEEL